MMSRLRLLSALLTLLTLSLTVVEGVWASTCMPGMEMGEVPAVTMSHAGIMGVMAPAGTQHAEDAGTEPGSPAVPHCPLAAAPGACIALATSLPAHPSESFTLSPEGALLVISPVQSRDLLFISAFFRPPRA